MLDPEIEDVAALAVGVSQAILITGLQGRRSGSSFCKVGRRARLLAGISKHLATYR